MEYAGSRWPIALILLDTVYFVMGKCYLTYVSLQLLFKVASFSYSNQIYDPPTTIVVEPFVGGLFGNCIQYR